MSLGMEGYKMTARKDQKQVLIVDHDHPLRDDLVDMLKGRQIGTVISGSAQEGLELLRARGFHLVLLGPLSSYGETLNFMQNIRADAQLKNIPVILMSAYYYSPLFQEQAKQFSKSDYIVRPISTQGLFDHIGKMMLPV